MTYTSVFSIALGPTYAGLTLAAQLVTTQGEAVGAPITSGFAALGGGDYLWTATLADAFRGAVLFADTATDERLAFAAINPEEINPFTAAVPGTYTGGSAGAALGTVSAATVTFVSAVADTGDVELLRGDDYLVANGRALAWTSVGWPTLTGGTILFSVQRSQGELWTKAGAVTAPTAARVEITASDTVAIGAGLYPFDLQATVGGAVTTLLRGSLRVLGDVR